MYDAFSESDQTAIDSGKSFVEMLGRATTLSCGAAGNILCLCLTITSWMWAADYILIFYNVDHLIYIYKPY